jgi:hypothetical protein
MPTSPLPKGPVTPGLAWVYGVRHIPWPPAQALLWFLHACHLQRVGDIWGATQEATDRSLLTTPGPASTSASGAASVVGTAAGGGAKDESSQSPWSSGCSSMYTLWASGKATRTRGSFMCDSHPGRVPRPKRAELALPASSAVHGHTRKSSALTSAGGERMCIGPAKQLQASRHGSVASIAGPRSTGNWASHLRWALHRQRMPSMR